MCTKRSRFTFFYFRAGEHLRITISALASVQYSVVYSALHALCTQSEQYHPVGATRAFAEGNIEGERKKERDLLRACALQTPNVFHPLAHSTKFTTGLRAFEYDSGSNL